MTASKFLVSTAAILAMAATLGCASKPAPSEAPVPIVSTNEPAPVASTPVDYGTPVVSSASAPETMTASASTYEATSTEPAPKADRN